MAAGLRGLRLDGPNALPHVLHGSTVREQDRLKAGPDAALGQKSAWFLVHLDHGRHVMELDGPAEIVQRVQIEGSVFGHELHVVEDARVTHHLHHGGPDTVQMGGQGGLTGLELLLELVFPHG